MFRKVYCLLGKRSLRWEYISKYPIKFSSYFILWDSSFRLFMLQSKTIIDKENLQTAIRNLSHTYVFTPRYPNKSMQHAAYCQYVMWKHGHVGARRRMVIPSCCVCAIRNAYLSPTNQYTGFLNVGGLAICD